MNCFVRKKGWIAAALLAVALSGCSTSSPYKTVPADQGESLPPLNREFRGVWVATVANIDWPSKPALSAEQQQAELIKILDRVVELKFNTVIFQVRPQCDAVYRSKLEPWSASLTGTMGCDPGYDPLEFAVKEAHKRHLELHAWLNPFRALLKDKAKGVSANHISKTHPDWVLNYGKLLWLDPGIPEARDYSMSVLLDIVKRYDVDGIHFDDYFYPYHEEDAKGKVIPFPDTTSRAEYLKRGGKLELDDWRRDSANQFVKTAYDSVKKMKPWVKFGIAPFGVWKSGFPVKTKATDSYSTLYGDCRKWLQEGWVDYLSPQLYWPTDHPDLPFEKLINWWVDQNTLHRGMWPGLYTSSVGEKDEKTGKVKISVEELGKEIALDRKQSGTPGTVHFSAKALIKNKNGVADLLAKLYQEPALVPAAPWLGKDVSAAPELTARSHSDKTTLHWSAGAGEHPWQWLVQKRAGQTWSQEIVSAKQTKLVIASDLSQPDAIVVRAIDRFGNAGAPAILRK